MRGEHVQRLNPILPGILRDLSAGILFLSEFVIAEKCARSYAGVC